MASPRPVPLPNSLVVKNGSKMCASVCLLHAATVVAHGQQHIFAGHKSRMVSAIVLVKNRVLRFDGDLANSRDGVPGIDTQVGQNLVDLGRDPS